MRIVYFIDRLSTPGGMERILSLKTNYLADILKYDVHIITTSHEEEKTFFKFSDKIKIHGLDINYASLGNKKGFRRIKANRKLLQENFLKVEKKLMELKPELCVSLFNKEVFFLPKIKDGSKKVVEYHFSKNGILEETKSSRFPKLMYYYFKYIELRKYTKCIKKYDAFVTLTEEDLLAWEGVKNKYYIPNPLTFYPTDNKIDYSKKQVIAVGRISHQKGFDLLIKSWFNIKKKFPDWKLIIVGRRDHSDNLDQMIELYDLKDQVEVLSATSDIIKFYNESSVFVLSSRYEGFGMVLVEAAACGLPMVSFSCPAGPSEIIINNEDGLLAEPYNVEDLSNKLMILMKDEQLRERMGEKAKKNILRFSQDKIMFKWDTLFKKIVE